MMIIMNLLTSIVLFKYVNVWFLFGFWWIVQIRETQLSVKYVPMGATDAWQLTEISSKWISMVGKSNQKLFHCLIVLKCRILFCCRHFVVHPKVYYYLVYWNGKKCRRKVSKKLCAIVAGLTNRYEIHTFTRAREATKL